MFFTWSSRTRVLFGAGTIAHLGGAARELGMRHVLLVADPGIREAGYADRASALLRGACVRVTLFTDFDANPDGDMVDTGARAARRAGVDGIVAVGGGSSLDCAKGINFVLTGGGTIADYRGYGKARGPMLPMIGVPTTAGTGSDAQSYAVLSDARTHVKMACGDPGAAFRIAILDPDLTRTQPRAVTAAAGYDALSHAVEAWVTVRRTPLSQMFAREAWRLVNGHLERVLACPGDGEARSAMLLGAHLAGLAIEHSMLGAAHACANPLTARYGTTHGVAVSLMLPQVVRWNAAAVGNVYAELIATGDQPPANPGERLATRLESIARTCGFPATLREAGVDPDALPSLAEEAAAQWTGTFNPRPLTREAALELYRLSYA
ncbi:MAG TPA: iron-containing alcohol dehydrogenase [Vicinamibacterales bacterium]